MSRARERNFLSSGVSKEQELKKWLCGRPAFLQIEQVMGLRWLLGLVPMLGRWLYPC